MKAFKLFTRKEKDCMTKSISDYALRVQVDLPYEQAVEKVTAALKEEGFGVLTEIDVIVQTHKMV